METIGNAAISHTNKSVSGCPFCILRQAKLCTGGGLENADCSDNGQGRELGITAHTIQTRQMIHHPQEFSEFVIVICSGQAVSSIGLPDGRRQILEILLPGDIVFWTTLFEPMSGRLIEAVTNSTYRKLKRREFHVLLSKRPDLFEMFMKLCTYNKAQSDQLALTLGRRSAAQRIAKLILTLAERSAERGLLNDQTMRFPLRLQHVGDATGLTPIHVSRVLRELQKADIIDLEARSLKIINFAELRQIAGP